MLFKTTYINYTHTHFVQQNVATRSSSSTPGSSAARSTTACRATEKEEMGIKKAHPQAVHLSTVSVHLHIQIIVYTLVDSLVIMLIKLTYKKYKKPQLYK